MVGLIWTHFYEKVSSHQSRFGFIAPRTLLQKPQEGQPLDAAAYLDATVQQRPSGRTYAKALPKRPTSVESWDWPMLSILAKNARSSGLGSADRTSN